MINSLYMDGFFSFERGEKQTEFVDCVFVGDGEQKMIEIVLFRVLVSQPLDYLTDSVIVRELIGGLLDCVHGDTLLFLCSFRVPVL